jgi:hypothetical protein
MRRSSSEIRRAIQFEDGEILAKQQGREQGEHIALRDVLRWALGLPGTEYEKLIKERKHEDVAKMPAKGAR